MQYCQTGYSIIKHCWPARHQLSSFESLTGAEPRYQPENCLKCLIHFGNPTFNWAHIGLRATSCSRVFGGSVSTQIFIRDKIASPHLLDVKIGSPHLPDVSFEGPLTCWMSVLRVPSLAGCQFLEGPLTCLDVMWSLFWSKLDLKMKIWPTSGRFGENCLLKLVLVCPILTQWWNKKKRVYFPFKGVPP